nr:hypothetical protein [Xenorhabdus budapestensis]
MQQNTTPATVHPAELSPFAEIFPHTGSLELMLLEHTFIKAAAVLCDCCALINSDTLVKE